MEVAVRVGVHITNIDDVFECEADGISFICLDSDNK